MTSTFLQLHLWNITWQKRGFFFSTLFFPFLNLIKNEIGPKNIERNKFKFTKNCTLSKSH